MVGERQDRVTPVDACAVVEAVSNSSEEQDATRKIRVYAKLGIQHYWIVRGEIRLCSAVVQAGAQLTSFPQYVAITRVPTA